MSKYKEYIARPHYFEKVRPFIGKEIIKVFVGQRRVGKSYLMYQVIDYIKQQDDTANIIYVDKEDDAFDAIVDYKTLLDYITVNVKEGRKNAVFIDEIQEIEQFEKALRSIHAKKGYDVYVTGSNANMLSGELATFLSGRYIEISVFSLSYPEFLVFHKLEVDNKSFQKFLRYGGLPFLVHLPLEDHIVFEYLKNISETIIYRDIVKRYGVRNIAFLESLISYVADNLGSIVSASKISKFLKSQNIKISTNVVIDYLSHLNNAYLVKQVKRVDIKGKKIFEIGEKYYFQDIGLRNSLVGFNAVSDIGKVLENVVYSHLLFMGYKVKIGILGDMEIDFVAERNGQMMYVQVCYLLAEQSTIDREFGNLLKIQDQYPKMVLSMDEHFGESSYQGIKHQSIRSFLSKE